MNNPTTHTTPTRQGVPETTGWSSQTAPGQTMAEDREGRRGPRLAVRSFTETKAGIKTTEFWIMLAAVAGILVATYADSDSFARVDGWKYVSWIVIAYVISRGLAKLGTREPSIDRID